MLLPNLALLITLAATSPHAADDSALDPVSTRLTAAREAYLQRDLGLAHDLLRAALEQAPGEPGVRLWLARVLNDLGHGEEAARVIGPALAGNDGSAWLWTELGRARSISGEVEQAERAFRAAVERDPRCGPPRLRLVDLLVDGGRALEAQAVLAPLLEVAGDALPVVLARASLLGALGQAAASEECLRGALEHPAARLALARQLTAAGRTAQAWAVAEPLLEHTRDPAGLVFLAQVAQAAGRPVDALAILGAALVADPTHAVALGAMNELIEHRADLLRRGLTERWVAARPDDVAAWRELLETDLDAGRLEAFFARLAQLPAAVRPATPVRLLEGEALRRAGREDEARAVLDALCAAADEPRAWYELGLLDYGAGDPAAAARAFERGAAGPWAADAHFNRGVCLDRLGRYADAAQAYLAAIEARPDLAQAWLQLGADQRHRLGQPERARESFRRYLELGGDDPEVRRFVEDGR